MRTMSRSLWGAVSVLASILLVSSPVLAGEPGEERPELVAQAEVQGQEEAAQAEAERQVARRRGIEEIVVTAERREATVSDTSISITAMTQDFILENGIQGADELVNLIPAATRTNWDIKIRGIGRNFRSLGGDPGVATYYNGVYSPDFGIAATENALYDIARVEVLRGPQGTLYGRNSIGGALNYITNSPTYNWEGQFRGIVGRFNTREYYGILSGPIIDEKLAFRLVGTVRDREGSVDGIGGSEDLNSINDNNISLALRWDVTDDIVINLRGNDRRVDNKGAFGGVGDGLIFANGPAGDRTTSRQTDFYAYGLRPVAADYPGALEFTHPNGDVLYGARNRPGVDPSLWPFQPNTAFGDSGVAGYDSGEPDDPHHNVLTNDYSDQEFDHRSFSFDITWEVGENSTLKYIFGTQEFEYYFDRDWDGSRSLVSDWGDTVIEDVRSTSHELQFLWGVGERLTGTSGLFLLKEKREQHYGLRNRFGKGFITDAADYGAVLFPLHLLGIIPETAECFDFRMAEKGESTFGAYCGDPGTPHHRTQDTGAAYEHENRMYNSAYAVFTQVDWQFMDTLGVTLGIRYAKDRRRAKENRGGYSEIYSEWYNFAHFFFAPETFPGLEQMAGLDAVNVLMGNATANFLADGTVDPENPITPVCPLESTTCDHPLRLGGIPIGWGSRIEGSDDWDRVNWRLNFNWTPTDDILVYFGATTGYRAGGYSLGEPDARDDVRDARGAPIPGAGLKLESYREEDVLAYELGYKGLHFDDTLQIYAAAYAYLYDDYQDRVDIWDPVRNQGVGVVRNVAEIKNTGFEIEATWLPTDSLRLGGNYSYTRSRYDTDFIVFNDNDPRFPASIFGCVADPERCGADVDPTLVPLYTRNVNNKQIKGIPEHKGALWASYEWNTNWGRVKFYNVLSITGSYFTNSFQRSFEKVPQRERWDMRLTWTSPDETLQFSAFMDNVLDKTYLRNVGVWGEEYDFWQYGVALYPRYFGLEFTYNWQR